MQTQEGWTLDTPAADSTGWELDTSSNSHGASGSWQPEQSPAEKAVRAVIDPLARFGQGATDATGTVLHSPIDIVKAAGSPPQNDAEVGMATTAGGIGLLTHRLIIQPTIDNAKAFLDAAKKQDLPAYVTSGLGMIPVIGPAIKEVLDQARQGDVAGAAGKAAAYSIAPKAVEEVTGKIGRDWEDANKYRQNRPLVSPTPQGHLRLSLNPELNDEGLNLAGEQLKAGERKIGKPVKDIDSAREAAKAQFQQELMPQRRAIIDPQKSVVVPGSRGRLIQAKIDAIPKDIIRGTKEYADAVKQAKSSVPSDLSIGDLEEITSSLNSQNRGYHQAKLSQSLSKMENANGAMDVAAEQTARQLMEEGMEKNGLGNSAGLKAVNKRIGALIKLEDSIDAAEKTARKEAALPSFRRLKLPTPSSPSIFKDPTVNEGIANAMQSWQSQSPAINTKVRPIIDTKRQLTSQNSIDLGSSPDTSYVRGQRATPAELSRNGRPRMITERAGGPIALPEDNNPPVAQSSVTGINGELAKGPFTGKPLEGEQQPLPGLPKTIGIGKRLPANPKQGQVFAERQKFPESGTYEGKIPAGTKLAFKSKDLSGRELYHYETPEGKILTLDHELTFDYEPGTKATGNPYSGPTPPPRLRKGQKKL